MSDSHSLLEFSLIDSSDNIIIENQHKNESNNTILSSIKRFINNTTNSRKKSIILYICLSFVFASVITTVMIFATRAKHKSPDNSSSSSKKNKNGNIKKCNNNKNANRKNNNNFLIQNLKDSNITFMDLTFPGTHNSAINLSPKLPDMPEGTEFSKDHPSVSQQPFYYIVLNQRLSVFDQLEQGIRYLTFETVNIPNDYKCPSLSSNTNNVSSSETCACKYDSMNYCFQCCDILVTHGTFAEAVNANTGYSFLYDLFIEIKFWIENDDAENGYGCHNNTDQILWIYLDSYTLKTEIEKKRFYKVILSTLKKSGLYAYIYNPPVINNNNNNIVKVEKSFLLYDMLRLKKNVVLSFVNDVGSSKVHILNNLPIISNYYVTKTPSNDDPICFEPKSPCHIGWDSHNIHDMSLNNIAILHNSSTKNNDNTFAMYHMSSSRDMKPYLAGGNPWEASLLRNKSLIFEKLLLYKQKYNQHVNIVAVDFFNTKVTSKVKPFNMKLLSNIIDNDNNNDEFIYYDAVTEAVCKFNNYNLKDDSIQNNINISYVIGCNYIKN